jgi:hypothetical protein
MVKVVIDKENMLEDKYPNIADWINGYGWIELGQNDDSRSMIRVLDEGGMVWESSKKYKSLDELFDALEKKLSEKIDEIG